LSGAGSVAALEGSVGDAGHHHAGLGEYHRLVDRAQSRSPPRRFAPRPPGWWRSRTRAGPLRRKLPGSVRDCDSWQRRVLNGSRYPSTCPPRGKLLAIRPAAANAICSHTQTNAWCDVVRRSVLSPASLRLPRSGLAQKYVPKQWDRLVGSRSGCGSSGTALHVVPRLDGEPLHGVAACAISLRDWSRWQLLMLLSGSDRKVPVAVNQPVAQL